MDAPAGGFGAEGPGTLHARISDWLRQKIASGEWPAHYRLQTEPELAAALGVSRGTLRRALATLIAEGALVQVRGKGTFVTSTVVEPAIAQKLTSLAEDFADHGTPLSTQVIECRLFTPPAPIAALLHTPADQQVLRLVRLRGTDEGPVAYLENYVRTDLAPGLDEVDFTTTTLFGVLASRYALQIASGRRTFAATSADDVRAAALDVPAGHPLQHLEQITYLASGTPIEYSDVWIRSDRLRVTSLLTRD